MMPCRRVANLISAVYDDDDVVMVGASDAIPSVEKSDRRKSKVHPADIPPPLTLCFTSVFWLSIRVS